MYVGKNILFYFIGFSLCSIIIFLRSYIEDSGIEVLYNKIIISRKYKLSENKEFKMSPQDGGV